MALRTETRGVSILTPHEFEDELDAIGDDSIRERQVQDLRPMCLTLKEATLAFMALRAHAKEEGDLFYNTVPPTDDALALIFAFLILP